MKKTTEQFAEELFERHELTLCSEYEGAGKLVTFMCLNGHENTALATNVLQRGYLCKQCTLGYKVSSKTVWDEDLIAKCLNLLKIHTTLEAAKELGVTVHAINNMISKNELTNSTDRHTETKLIEKLKLQGRTLISECKGTHTLVKIKCKEGHEVFQQVSNVISHNTGCPKCFSLGTSSSESELVEFIKSIYPGWIELRDRSIVKPKELDIVLPDLGIAIEYNGTYWHREDKVGRTYHLDKTELVESIGYQLIHIKDYDWCSKQEVIKSLLRAKLGLLQHKIFARSTILREIKFPREFLDLNHLQGSGQPSSLNYGLFYKEELVAVATFGKPRFDKNQELELYRFCTKLNTHIPGALSKLLKPIRKSLVTYAARDYSNAKGYLATGFKLIRSTEPGLEYYKRGERLSRYKAQSMTQEDLAMYYKYYNSGNLVLYRPTN